MAEVGTWIIYLIMAFVVIGAIAAIRAPERGIGKEFIEGLHSIGPIFIPVAGVMATIPYLARFIEHVVGPALRATGADPSVASGVVAVDMGGYQLAAATADHPASWILASILGFTLGCTLVFTVPLGLTMLPTRDHKYMALGVLAGILTVPLSALITVVLMITTHTDLRSSVRTSGESDWGFTMPWGQLLLDLAPIAVVVVLIALGLRFVPTVMLAGFKWFGKFLDITIKLVLALSIIEYFTGAFSTLLGTWGLDPIIADKEDNFRALEVAGYSGLILAGAFPLVHVIRTYGQKPLSRVGRLFGLSADVTAGVLATSANVIALLRLIPSMKPRDKVLCIAFMVCATDTLGGHLAFATNVQPSLLGPLLIGKFVAGAIAMVMAYWLTLPIQRRLEEQDRAAGVIGPEEYADDRPVTSPPTSGRNAHNADGADGGADRPSTSSGAAS